MREERFREDLYYRLRRVVLTVPPLRERSEDLPLLIEHFRSQVNTRHRLAIEGVTPGAMRRLTVYRWPGNVRELEAVLEEAMILKGRGWLGPENLALAAGADGTGLAIDYVESGEPQHDLSGRQQVALELARTRGRVTRSQLAAACQISGELARRELQALARLGFLRRTGQGRGTRYLGSGT
jgi:DNA-binding NtrC family response regulator